MITKRKIYQARTLKLLSDYLTISNIAKTLNKDDKTIYQNFLNYRKKGWINEDRTLTTIGLQITEEAFTMIKDEENLKPNSARLNNLVFSIIIPKVNKWKSRDKYLILKNIDFKTIDLGTWKAQQIVIDNVKVWLTSSRIRIYMPDYYAETPFEAYSNALDDLYKIVLKLENKLSLRLIRNNGIDFDLPKRDIALIKNEVAKKYNKEKRKLHVYDDFNRLRLIIDASKSKITGVNLNELEAVNPELSLDDSTKTQNYFLNVIDKPHYLPSETKEKIDNNSEKMDNIKIDYSRALQDLKDNGLIPLTEQIKLHLEVQRSTLELQKNTIDTQQKQQRTMVEMQETLKELRKPFFINWYEYFKNKFDRTRNK